jgi:hypothetical protein
LAKALGVKPATLFAEEDEPEALVRYAACQKRKIQLGKMFMEAIYKAFDEGDLQ